MRDPLLRSLLLASSTPLFLACASPGPLEWSRFRGPNGSGLGAALSVPERIAPDTAAWRTEILPGYSSPVLGHDALFLTGFEETQLFTFCIDRESGEVRWRVAAPEPLEQASRGPNSPVSPTPVTDGENVWVFHPHFGVVAYDKDGGERWRLAMEGFTNPYGMGTSPVLVGDTLLLQCDQDVGSYLLAVHADDGSVRWRTERPGVTHGFASPVVYEPTEGEAEILVSGSYRVMGYSLETGEMLWWMDGMAWQAKSTPVVVDDMLYVHSWMAAPTELGMKKVSLEWADALAAYDADANGELVQDEVSDLNLERLWFLFDLDSDDALQEPEWDNLLARGKAQNGLWAIRLGGRGDVSKTHRVWHYKRSLPNIPSPLVYDGLVYLIKDGGIVSAIGQESGELVKSGRVEGGEGSFFASPVAAGGRLIASTQDGRVAVLAAGEDWSTLSVGEFEEEIWATPALGADQVFVRTQAALYCFQS